MEELETATKLLNVSKESNETQVLLTYQRMLNDSTTQQRTKNLIKAKNTVIQSIIEKQLKQNRFFTLKIPPDFNACGTCKGTGQIYKLRVEVTDTCKSCRGTGVRTESCKHCKGTGSKITSKGKKKCPTCKGTRVYQFKKGPKRLKDEPCQNCLGTGNKKRLILTGRIEKHTTCITCRGIGIKDFRFKKIRRLSNPVLKQDLGSVIKNLPWLNKD